MTAATAPSKIKTLDLGAYLQGTRASTAKAAERVEAAKRAVAEAQATAAQLQTAEGDAILAGSKTLVEAGAELAAAMSVVDAAKRGVEAAKRGLDVAMIDELRAFSAVLRRRAFDEEGLAARQQLEAGEFVRKLEERDAALFVVYYPVNQPDVAGLVSQAAAADSRADQIEESLTAPAPEPRRKISAANSAR